MTWMAIGFWIMVGVGIGTGVWLAFMYFVAKRGERQSAMARAILDKMEGRER